MGRAVLYRRVSTREQEDRGLGMAAQEVALSGWTDSRAGGDWLPVWVEDPGVSGSVAADERPGLGPELAAMRPGDALVVAKLDRLSRSVLDFSRILTLATEGGWSIVVLDLGVDMTTPNGRLIAHILAAVAEWERHMISIRIREGLAQSKKRLGRPPGSAPTSPAPPAPVPERTEAMVRDALAEGLSPQRVADRLNRYGVPSLRGGRWHRESVRRLVARLDVAGAGAA